MNDKLEPKLQLIAWEITRRCNLLCAHCRASAENIDYEGELSTEDCFRIIDDISQIGKPILILTGGEPLLRPDIFQIGQYANDKGLRVVLGTNGTIITTDIVQKIKGIPISRVGVSLDFPNAELQDEFRGQAGAFEAAISGIKLLTKAGIGIQINSTITKKNAPHLEDILNLALELGAVAFHPFLLVPTGRGKRLAAEELSPQEYEQILNWVCDKQKELGDRIFFKPTDAPHYIRILKQRGETGPQKHPGSVNAITRGCLAGIGFCFISHVGRIQGCGYLDVEAGNLKIDNFAKIWNESSLFNELRDLSKIEGKCGECNFKRICGGCRARAYEATGNYLAAEPYCIYQPSTLQCEVQS